MTCAIVVTLSAPKWYSTLYKDDITYMTLYVNIFIFCYIIGYVMYLHPKICVICKRDAFQHWVKKGYLSIEKKHI